MTKRATKLGLALLFFATSAAFGDPTTEKVQQALKDQGFYYGEITGTMDADTTAAIRRYQIRNGLKISGQLDAETQKALGVTRAVPAKPSPTAEPTRAPDTSDLRDDSTTAQPREQEPPTRMPPGPAPQPYPAYPPAPGPQGDNRGVFDGTPYEGAPPGLQQSVIVGAQTMLARRGYYRSDIDGVFGPGTELALRAFQSAVGLAPTGRLDKDTLGALRLLPRQRGLRPRWWLMRPPPVEVAPNGEPIYGPR